MLGAMFLVIFMSTLASRYHFEVLHAVYALFCCFFILYSQTKLQSQIELQHELDVQQQLWLKQKSQYEMAKENIDLINTKCHDLKHQVAALRTMTSQEKQQKAIDSIEDAVMFYDSMIQTGNEILNTVLTEKSLLCQSHQITLQCMADGEKIQFMDPVDLYTLFGNALDNAIEAVSGLSQEMRIIHLSIQEHARMVFIQIDNPYEGELDLQGGMLQTHKKDKNYHGFGIKSMIQLTEKYHGILKTETEHQIFVLRISIPLP
jgi:sensor histidine kinase regulating citrate/malate metabolism